MKVVIVGASLAGLFTAYLLSKEGVAVEVYEKEPVLGRPSRTLIVTSELKSIIPFLPQETILNQIRYLQVFSTSKSTTLELRVPDLVVERETLVKFLARLAEEAGAKLSLGHRCEGFTRSGQKVWVHSRVLGTNEEKRTCADILIGADGYQSVVTHETARNGQPLVALYQARVKLPKEVKPNSVQVWLNSNRTRYFYWLIPESERTAAVGLIAEEDRQTEACLMGFLQEKGWEPFEFQSAMVPLHRCDWRRDGSSDGRNVFRVGDAAAQVKVTTVGGVVTGLRGAKALCDAILNGKSYSHALKPLKMEMNLHLFVRQILNRFREEDYNQLIGMIDGELKEVLETWNRDELKQSFLKLVWAEPRLIPLSLKALMKSLF